jgi:hypothetical protein
MSGPMRERPRSRSFIAYDKNNAYERLGVSPLASTAEILSRIFELRQEASRLAKSAVDASFGEETEAVLKIDEIADTIGDPVKRQQYDGEHPQNIMLTVQPSSMDRFQLPYRRAGLISEWLREKLEHDVFLPTPSSSQLWLLDTVDQSLLDFLEAYCAHFPAEETPEAERRNSQMDPALLWQDGGLELTLPTPNDLNNLIKEKRNG